MSESPRRPTNPLSTLLGGEDEVQERVRSTPILQLFFALTPVAVGLRFGGFGIHETLELATAVYLIAISTLLLLQWLGTFLAAANRRTFVLRRRDWTVFSLLMPTVAVLAWINFGFDAGLVAFSTHSLVVLFVRAFLRLLGSQTCCDRPGMTLSVTFAAIIVGGSVVLGVMPRTLESDHALGFIDALFISTSATCVTGLETVSINDTFTPFGQGVVLALVQIGGLGIMTFGAFVVLSTGRRLGLTDRELVREALNTDKSGGLFRQLVGILLLTFCCEALGAWILLPAMESHETPRFAAVFHAVSAFCNAGFTLTSDSLTGHVVNWRVNGVIMVLVVIGGLGFGVVQETITRWSPTAGGRTVKRLSLNCRLTLLLTALLIVIGAAGMWALEHDRALAGMPASEQVLASTFQSVSARTAGFQSVPFVPNEDGQPGISSPTRFWMIGLMIIGASPGSTGGGIKTITFGVLILGILALFRHRERIEVFGRTIPSFLMRRAAALAVVYVLTLFVGTLAMLITDGSRFTLEELAFEATSALGTVGFSIGVSGAPELSGAGKVVLILLMFAGRIGPLTLVLVSTSARSGETGVGYPEERVIIG